MTSAPRPAATEPAAAGGSVLGDPDPTLLQLAREGLRWAWFGIAVIIVGLIAGLLAVTVFRPGAPKGGGATVRVNDATPPFKLGYARGELRVISATPQKVELTDRKPGDPQGSRLFVTPMPMSPYKGSPTGALPLTSQRAKAVITARFDTGSVRFVDEGLINIGPNPGYQLSYTAKRNGATWYGRAAVVVPDTDGETGAVLMDGEEQRTTDGAIVSPRAVGRTGDLRLPMRSLTFQ
ncbi:MAG: hypothetical protein AAGC46_20750 [Solirubrobacteraceae bacterium]|nr:hypothetical protein [Patulibacter sp.]